MPSLYNSLAVSASGLVAQAERLNIVSQNIANASTPGYQRKELLFAAALNGTSSTVSVDRITLDNSELTRVYSPSHPLADASGYYEGSNVNLMLEVADSREAQRSYEANLRSFDTARQMQRSLLELIKR